MSWPIIELRAYAKYLPFPVVSQLWGFGSPSDEPCRRRLLRHCHNPFALSPRSNTLNMRIITRVTLTGGICGCSARTGDQTTRRAGVAQPGLLDTLFPGISLTSPSPTRIVRLATLTPTGPPEDVCSAFPTRISEIGMGGRTLLYPNPRPLINVREVRDR